MNSQLTSPYIVLRIVGVMFPLIAFPASAQADIFQWEYINPADPSQGKRQSTTLATGGAGVNAVPGANLGSRNLTMAYLIGADLTDAFVGSADLTNADLSQANLTDAVFIPARLTGADFTNAEVRGASFPAGGAGLTTTQLYSTASYQAHDLTGIVLGGDLSGWNFVGQKLSNARFDYTRLTGADFTGAQVRGTNFSALQSTGFTLAQLYSTASYQAKDLSGIGLAYNDLAGGNFAGQNLTNANFRGATLEGADFTGAEVQGANFSRNEFSRRLFGTGISDAQLYSTVSYQTHDLSGISFALNLLGGANFSNQNLTNASFHGATLTSADFTNANIRGANFGLTSVGCVGAGGYCNLNMGTGITLAQLYSTASYQARDLSGISFYANILAGGNFAGQNLTNTSIGFEGGGWLAGADLSAADLRGARYDVLVLSDATTTNLILSDGHVRGLNLDGGERLVVRDYDGDPIFGWGPIPITIDQHMMMGPGGTLRMVFEADDWDSTISFAPGIPVALGGTLELTFAPDVNPAGQLGRTFDLFDWTGIEPIGAFTVAGPYAWDLSNLYTTGEVTLTAVPEPASIAFSAAGVGMILLRRRPSTCKLK